MKGAIYSEDNFVSCSPRNRFRRVPAFGDKIRRFEGNVSDMKRLAGHDLEDVLQVCEAANVRKDTNYKNLVHHPLHRRLVS